MNKIKLFLKFGEEQHMLDFANGNLFCSDATTFWGIENEMKAKGQGDILEAGIKIWICDILMDSVPEGRRTKLP